MIQDVITNQFHYVTIIAALKSSVFWFPALFSFTACVRERNHIKLKCKRTSNASDFSLLNPQQ